jgi:hypothetical protein
LGPGAERFLGLWKQHQRSRGLGNQSPAEGAETRSATDLEYALTHNQQSSVCGVGSCDQHLGGVTWKNRKYTVFDSLGCGFKLLPCCFCLLFLFFADVVKKSLASATCGLPVVPNKVRPLRIQDKKTRQSGHALTGQFYCMVQGILRSLRTVYRNDNIIEPQTDRPVVTSWLAQRALPVAAQREPLPAPWLLPEPLQAQLV